MTFERKVDVKTTELMDLLKEDLLANCITRDGYPNLSGDEEKHLLELYKILKPLGEYVMSTYELQYEVIKMREENK